MDTVYLSGLSALAGSVVGGLTTGLMGWLNQRQQAKADLLAHNLSRREELFKDFIVAASKAYGDALMSDKPQIQELVGLFAMVSRMRVLCSAQIVVCAENVMHATNGAYELPNKTAPEVNVLMKSGAGIEPLKDFAIAAREELQTFSAA